MGFSRQNKGGSNIKANRFPHITRHKYHAIPNIFDGIRFDSRKEARYYAALKTRQAIGEVIFFTRQQPFHLPGRVIYRVDFTEYRADGTVHFIDVKGMETKEFIMKKKLVEALYPIEIEVVK